MLDFGLLIQAAFESINATFPMAAPLVGIGVGIALTLGAVALLRRIFGEAFKS